MPNLAISTKKQKKDKKRRFIPKKTTIQYADEGQCYGFIKKVVGNCSFMVVTSDELVKFASLSGNVKHSGRVKIKDIVLMESLDTNDNKFQIIYKYSDEQVKILQKENHITKLINLMNEVKDTTTTEPIVEENFQFADEIKVKSIVEDIDEKFIDDI